MPVLKDTGIFHSDAPTRSAEWLGWAAMWGNEDQVLACAKSAAPMTAFAVWLREAGPTNLPKAILAAKALRTGSIWAVNVNRATVT